MTNRRQKLALTAAALMSLVVPLTLAVPASAADEATLSVSKTGNGDGTVTSSPGGIDCGGDCSNSYELGNQVTLTAAENATSVFTG